MGAIRESKKKDVSVTYHAEVRLKVILHKGKPFVHGH